MKVCSPPMFINLTDKLLTARSNSRYPPIEKHQLAQIGIYIQRELVNGNANYIHLFSSWLHVYENCLLLVKKEGPFQCNEKSILELHSKIVYNDPELSDAIKIVIRMLSQCSCREDAHDTGNVAMQAFRSSSSIIKHNKRDDRYELKSTIERMTEY